MIPYIAVLILLIVVILWQVYSQTESFTGTTQFNPVLLTESSTNRDLLENISKVVAKLYDLKGMYAGKIFTPKPTVEEAKLLGYTVTKDSLGKEIIQGDISADSLRTKLDDEVKIYDEQLKNAQNDVKIGAVRLDAKIVDKIYADSSLTKEQASDAVKEILTMLNTNNEFLGKKFGAYEDIYYRQYPAPAPVAPTTTTTTVSTTTAPTTTTSTPPTTTIQEPSSIFSMLTAKLAKAQDASGAEINVDLTKPKENVICSQPESMSKPTPEFTKEMEERLAKRVSSEIKNQLVSNYQLQGALQDMSPNAPCDAEPISDGIAQGAEYVSTQPTMPDMSQYVKKDSIPCWGCTLDY